MEEEEEDMVAEDTVDTEEEAVDMEEVESLWVADLAEEDI